MATAWSDEYATGDAEVDTQHKQLFQYLADLEAHMESGIDEIYVKKFLKTLGIYTRSHFCYEEICMRVKKCPVAEKNKDQHGKLLEAYTQFCQRFEREGVSDDLLARLHDFLESWLINHIMKVDTHLRKCANG